MSSIVSSTPAWRDRVAVVWLVLVAVTTVSWVLGTGPASGTVASVVVLVLALFKVRLVGLYFMELRDAPVVLRLLFELYCVAACAVLAGIVALA
ncbi:cytochrome C oxidase subunit IV family protein [Pseudonocardia sp. EV170527-09]|uniref:cytochrome C oxidase subunit IV family protein n=1 Tax=Pseudonocardia sp. EV170527-09 TaxID=2603411 RepID=UPI001F018DCC|nr:cytochrome C oxidase subunit IV family protein [Pseudonocardia sp. EV170527-09]